MSDAVQIQLITSLCTLAGMALTAWLAAKKVAGRVDEASNKQEAQAVKASAAVKEVALRQEQSTADAERKLDEIKRVQDGALGVQMKVAADALALAADKTGDLNIRAVAEHAERAYRDHEANLAAYGAQRADEEKR